jgi:hypothetical protein
MNDIDKRIFYLIEILVINKKVNNVSHFCSEIGMLRQTASRIKKGINHFTVTQIETICMLYNVNSNWILGLENNVFRTKDSIRISKI